MSSRITPNVVDTRLAGESLLYRLRRPAGLGGFVAEIDGLRYFAIPPVYAWRSFKVNVGDQGFALSYQTDRMFSVIGLGATLYFMICGNVFGARFQKACKENRIDVLDAEFLFCFKPPFQLITGRFGLAEGSGRCLASTTCLYGLINGSPITIYTVKLLLETELQFYILALALYAIYGLSESIAFGLFALEDAAFVALAHVLVEINLLLLTHGHVFFLGVAFPFIVCLSVDLRWWFLFLAALGMSFLIEVNHEPIVGGPSKLGLQYPMLLTFSNSWSAICAPVGFAAYRNATLTTVLMVQHDFFA